MKFKGLLNRDDVAEVLRSLAYGFAKGKVIVRVGLKKSRTIIPVGDMEVKMCIEGQDKGEFKVIFEIIGKKGKELSVD